MTNRYDLSPKAVQEWTDAALRAPVPLSLRLSDDTIALFRAMNIGLLTASSAELPQAVLQAGLRLVDIFENATDLLRVEGDVGAAAGATELVLGLRPEVADLLREFTAALRTGNVDGVAVEHGSSPSVSLATAMVEDAGAGVESAPVGADVMAVP